MAWVMTSNIYERVVLDEGDRDAQVRRKRQLSKALLETLPQHPFWHPEYVQFGSLTSSLLHPTITPPFFARIEEFQPPLLGMFRCIASYAVSATAIELIESVDPGVHRYHPFNLTMADGSLPPQPYMLLNIGQRADTIALEASPNMFKRMNDIMIDKPGTYPEWYSYRCDDIHYNSAAVYRDRVANLSIWYDQKLDQIMICDKLMSLFLEQGILRLENEAPYFLWHLREV